MSEHCIIYRVTIFEVLSRKEVIKFYATLDIFHCRHNLFFQKEGESMIGAIAGDIIGSVYERYPIKKKEFPLFQPRCFLRTIRSLPSVLRKPYWKTEIMRRLCGRLVENTLMPATAARLSAGSNRISPPPITAGAMVPPCG